MRIMNCWGSFSLVVLLGVHKSVANIYLPSIHSKHAFAQNNSMAEKCIAHKKSSSEAETLLQMLERNVFSIHLCMIRVRHTLH